MNYEDYRSAWERYPREKYVSRVPLHLDIEVTNKCNRSCIMCPYHNKGSQSLYYQRPKDMDLTIYRKIIDEFSEKGGCAIKLNFGGEPLLYRHVVEAVQYAKQKGIIDVQINTNGDRLDPRMSRKLLEAGLDKLILSDYGGMDQLINGISFNALRVHHSCLFHVNKTNREYAWRGMANQIDPPIFYDFEKAKDNHTITDFQCIYPWLRMLILADGTGMSCSCGSITKEQKLGNIEKVSLEEMWNSKKMNMLRYNHAEGYSHHLSYCRKCGLRDEWIRTGNVRF